MTTSRRYKMIRLPEADYEELRAARRELLRRGTSSLPREIVYESRGDEDHEDDDNSLTNGFVLGLGAAALLYLLSKSKENK